MCRGKWFPLLASLLFWIASLDARALTNVPPSRDPNNVIVAFYNIKWFGKTPRNIEKLARVIQHFDICSVLEIKNERVLKNLVRELEALTSHRWGFVFGVRTHRPGGRYHEAFGVIWRKDRAELGHGLVGGVWDREEVFRNDPYLTAFKAGTFDFLLFSIHTRWSDDADGTRKGEVAAIPKQLAYLWSFLEEKDIFIGGDFNFSGTAAPMKAMAEKANLNQLDDNDKTTFKRRHSDYANAYDHILATDSAMKHVVGRAQALDITTLIFGSRSADAMKRSKRELSDHLPVFAILNRNGEPPPKRRRERHERGS